MNRIIKIILGVLYLIPCLLMGVIAVVATRFYQLNVFIEVLALSMLAFAIFYLYRVIKNKASQKANIIVLAWVVLNSILFIIIPPQTYVIPVYLIYRMTNLWLTQLNIILIPSQIAIAGTVILDIIRFKPNIND